MKKRILAMALALMMLVSMFPLYVSAVGTTTVKAASVFAKTFIADVSGEASATSNNGASKALKARKKSSTAMKAPAGRITMKSPSFLQAASR